MSALSFARERYKQCQIPRSPSKEVVRAPQTQALDDQMDGFQGVVGPPAVFTLATLSLSQVGRKWMQIQTGRQVRVFQFWREYMSCFNEVWKFLHSCHGCQVLPSAVQELWSALMLLPLRRADLRVPLGPMVMASDASLTGGAICRSVGRLTARGLGAF